MRDLLYRTVIVIVLLSMIQSVAYAKPIVTINQFADHPALREASKGIRDGFKARDVASRNIILHYDNAQGNAKRALNIARLQSSFPPKVMIAIGTASADADLQFLPTQTLLAFVAVSDLAMTRHEKVRGITDHLKLENLLQMTKEILPQSKTMGVIFSRDDVNSTLIIDQLEKLTALHNMKLLKSEINLTCDLAKVVANLAKQVDVIYLPQDHLVISKLVEIVNTTFRAKIPLISSDPTTVKSGVLLALGNNYYLDGVRLANMIVDYLESGYIPPQATINKSTQEMLINEKIASKLGIKIPLKLRFNVGRL